jgi:hypothetical protein
MNGKVKPSHGLDSTFDGPAGILRLRLIGPMGIWAKGHHLKLPTSARSRAILAIVALSGSVGVPRGKVSKLLWSGRPEEQSRASMRQEIHHLGKYLTAANIKETLVITRDLLSFYAGCCQSDVDYVMLATRERPAAISLVDGVFLDGLDGLTPEFDQWLAIQRQRLLGHACAIARGLVDDMTPGPAIGVSKRLCERCKNGMADDSYESCVRTLVTVIGSIPSAQKQVLAREVNGAYALDATRAGIPFGEPGSGASSVGVVEMRPRSEANADLRVECCIGSRFSSDPTPLSIFPRSLDVVASKERPTCLKAQDERVEALSSGSDALRG